MAYVAVKGGQAAIEASIAQLEASRTPRGTSPDTPVLEDALARLVDQCMSEASLYAPSVAALAIKQAQGSPEEAVFLLRAWRSTLPRFHYTVAVPGSRMEVERRISACFKDIPGGQILGSCPDYTHRLLDFDLGREDQAKLAEGLRTQAAEYGVFLAQAREILRRQEPKASADPGASLENGEYPGQSILEDILLLPSVMDTLRHEGLLPMVEDDPAPPRDLTRQALDFPADRSSRLQAMSRSQTGAMTAFGYAALRGYGALHPTVGELRVGEIPLLVEDPAGQGLDHQDSGASPTAAWDQYYIGSLKLTQVETLVPRTVKLPDGRQELEFDIGFGACFGQNETKTIAMSLIDQCLEYPDEEYPTSDQEFVLYHLDPVEATGFISHLKLPHYVTFQSKLDGVRKSRMHHDPQADLAVQSLQPDPDSPAYPTQEKHHAPCP